jgi:hypothetical protein
VNRQPMFVTAIAGTILLTQSVTTFGISVRNSPLDHVSKSRSGELDSTYLTILGFTIGKSSIEDVRKTLGQAPEKQEENGPRQLCYVSKNPVDQTRVVFISGAMGGWETLTGFQVIGQEAWDDSLGCLQTEKISRSIRVGDNLFLGVSTTDLMKRLGTPTERAGHLIRWWYSGKQKMTQRERETAETTFKKSLRDEDTYFDSMSGIDASEKGDRVTSFAVDRAVSF